MNQTLVYCYMYVVQLCFITLPHITKTTFRLGFSWRKMVTLSFWIYWVLHAFFKIPYYEIITTDMPGRYFHHFVDEETEFTACGWNSMPVCLQNCVTHCIYGVGPWTLSTKGQTVNIETVGQTISIAIIQLSALVAWKQP